MREPVTTIVSPAVVELSTGEQPGALGSMLQSACAGAACAVAAAGIDKTAAVNALVARRTDLSTIIAPVLRACEALNVSHGRE